MHRRLFLGGAACLAVAGCSVDHVYAPDDVVSRTAYVHPGPKRVTLFTMINNETGAGAHSSIMINASQRVVFDPAGSVRHPRMPERNDVLYGITPRIADVYARAHARKTYHVVIQERVIPSDVAEAMFDSVRGIGPVYPARCTLSISTMLGTQPGFESIPRTWFPKKLMESFAELPGVKTRTLRENDDADKSLALADFDQVVIFDVSDEISAKAAAEAGTAASELDSAVRPVARTQ
ncbi:MAG: hypothetical protein ACPG7W_00155 [Paracoccaceae bacterium]